MQGSSVGILAATISRCQRAFGWVGLFSLCINLLMLTVSLYMLQMFDRVIASQSRETLIFLTIIAVGAVLVLGLLELVRSRILVGSASGSSSGWHPRPSSAASPPRSMAGPTAPRPARPRQLRSFLGGSADLLAVRCALGADLPRRDLPVASAGRPGRARRRAVLLFGFAVLNEVLTRTPLQFANRAATDAMQRAEAEGAQRRGDRRHGHDAGRGGALDGRERPGSGQQAVASDRAGSVLALSKFLRLAVQIAVLGVGALLVVRHELTAAR